MAGLLDPNRYTGVENGSVVLAFTDAVLGPEPRVLERERENLVARLGADAMVAAAAVAGNFSKNDRVANATGIPLEAQFVRDSADFREALGIDAFRSARNTLGP